MLADFRVFFEEDLSEITEVIWTHPKGIDGV